MEKSFLQKSWIFSMEKGRVHSCLWAQIVNQLCRHVNKWYSSGGKLI